MPRAKQLVRCRAKIQTYPVRFQILYSPHHSICLSLMENPGIVPIPIICILFLSISSMQSRVFRYHKSLSQCLVEADLVCFCSRTERKYRAHQLRTQPQHFTPYSYPHIYINRCCHITKVLLSWVVTHHSWVVTEQVPEPLFNKRARSSGSGLTLPGFKSWFHVSSPKHWFPYLQRGHYNGA